LRQQVLEEAGEELPDFCGFPASSRKSLRTISQCGTINWPHGQFRRCAETQASLPSEKLVSPVFSGLFASGQAKIRGWKGGSIWVRS